MNFKKYLLFSFLSLQLASCAPRLIEMDTNRRLPRDFERFFQKFGRDTAFQLARIPFPISGLPDNADDDQRERWLWTRQNWVFHLSKNYDKNLCIRNFIVRSPYEIEEYIFIKNTQFVGTYRRFERDKNDQWQLIFYSGLNAMPPKIEVLDLKIEEN